MMPDPAIGPSSSSLHDAAVDCREYALTGEPPVDTLFDWADLFDRAADALDATDTRP